ncbi:MAG: D-alanine--D-alanine ligase [Planctomycetota bacterium]|nr:D-alanine--D-alanine ligase [Planctomycetota bacterium]
MSATKVTTTPETGAAAPVSPTSIRLEEATVAVLMGGRSSEREVSLVSGRAVLAALTTPASDDDRRGPRRVIAVELLAQGSWSFAGRVLPPGEALAALADVDVFFLGLHGGEGEGGGLQGLLQAEDRAFTGSDVGASAVCLDKVFTRTLAEADGMRVPRAVCFSPLAWRTRRPAILNELRAWSVVGWVPKPRRGGSSVGVSIVRDPSGLEAAIELALADGDHALVEELVPGVEATAGVLGNPDGELHALPPIEIRPHEGRFFDYDEKYSESGALELCPPRALDAATCERLRALALRAHTLLGCEGYSRTDFIVPRAPDGHTGFEEPVLLEVNTLPGLTPRSLLPKEAAAEGTDFRTLCLSILRHGLDATRAPR